VSTSFGNIHTLTMTSGSGLPLLRVMTVASKDVLVFPNLEIRTPEGFVIDAHHPQDKMVQRTKTEGLPFFSSSLFWWSINPIGVSQVEQLLRVTSGIAAELIKAHDSNNSVSLNEVRARISKKYSYGGVPRLVDIISAIPDEYKKALLPKLKARPIRTASGVRSCSSEPPLSAWSS